MLVGIVLLFIAIVFLAIIYALGDKPSSKKINLNDTLHTNPDEIVTSDNALVYSGTMLGVITNIDSEDMTITLLDVNTEEERTFQYSGGTNILDKYDKMLGVSQLAEGLIVDAYYLDDTNKLVKVQISKNSWEYIGVTGLIINEDKGIISFHGQRYPLSNKVVVLDNNEVIQLSNIMEMDYTIIRGVKEKVCVVRRTKGHGYLKLANDYDYLGGMIHVGTEVIKQIEKDMIIAVREGTYSITVKHGKLSGTEEITIEKDKTVVFDVYAYGEPILNKGLVHFDITPAQAVLYIDGVEQSFVLPVELTYGEHKIEVSLGGYKTYQGTIVVDSTDLSYRISLSENLSSTDNDGEDSLVNDDIMDNGDSIVDYDDTFDDNTSEDNTSEDDWWSDDEGDSSLEEGSDEILEEDEEEDEDLVIGGVDENSTITITCSEGTKVYIDGSYIGAIKNGKLVSKKYIGTHIIELVLDGYSKKKYTIDLDDDGEDTVLNFPSFY